MNKSKVNMQKKITQFNLLKHLLFFRRIVKVGKGCCETRGVVTFG